MRIEEIALRQEARQMLCEAGLSKEELKELVLKDRVDKALTKAVNDIVRKEVEGYFYSRKLNIRATASFEE